VTSVDLLIVRHAQSAWNALGIWQGTEDPPLSALGQRQAEVAAEHLDGRFDEVWSSDLGRAQQTAETLARKAGLPAVRVMGELRERHAGPWQGLTRDEIEEGWPGWLDNGRRPPGYEGDEQLVGRALPALQREAATTRPGRVLVVSHGGVMMALDRHLGAPPQRYPQLTGRWFHLGDGELRPGRRVDLIPPTADLGLE
jgi:broad specificity phosphatase PhoE